ncbi:MAG TPA: hypothetical protein VKB79_23600 [Bryobacteraceae bacterium]|nr:hypothetical protein [Bryobacteraceae bacterium]
MRELLKSRAPKYNAFLTGIALAAALFQAPLSAQEPAWNWPWPTSQSGPPVLSSMTPNTAAQGTAVVVTLNGSNFDPNTTVRLSGGGARQGNVIFVSPTTITATFTFLSWTPTGADNVYVVNGSGVSSNILPFTVTPANTQSLSLLPIQANLLPSGSQTLTATVTGQGSQTLNWTLTPNVGTLQVNGTTAVYTAPATIPAPQTVVVTAQSVAQPTATASSTLFLSPILTLSLTAPSGPFFPSDSQTFTATGTGTAGGLTWSLTPNVGTLSAIGGTAVYTAPASITSQQTVTLTAQSNSTPSVTASQTLQLNPPVTLSLNAPSGPLFPSGTQTFNAAIVDTTNSGVTWSLNPNSGTLAANGTSAVYTAPSTIPSQASVTITVKSKAKTTVTASQTVQLNPAVTLSLNAPSGPLFASGTQAFTATIADPTNSGVTWSVSPKVGTLTINGTSAVYTAPASIPSSQNVTITVTSNAQTTVKASQTIQLNPQVTLTLNPPTATVPPSGTQTLTATIGNTTNQGITWSVSPTNFGALTTSGTTAVYTAPSTVSSQTTVTVTAQSNAQPSVTDSTIITVNPHISLSLNPGTVTLDPMGTQQFIATVQGTTNTGVTWLLQPNLGTITPSGLYTAPSSLPANVQQTVILTATSAQDTTVSSSALIVLNPGVTFTMGTNGLSSLAYNGQSFYYGPMAPPSFANVYQTLPTGTSKGAGATASKTVTDPVANTVTQTFGWGTAVTQYQAAGNKLLITVTLSNTLSNPITRYWMFPLSVQLPATPLNYSNNTSFSLDAPADVFFDYGSGTIDLADEDIVNPMAMSLWAGTNPVGPIWRLSLYVDPNSNLNPNWPGITRPVPPGGSDTITLSLRFGAAGETQPQLVSDLYTRFAATFPRLLPPVAVRKPMARLTFTGRFRPTFPTNPRGWFNDPTIDVTTPAGIANFQQRLLLAGDAAVAEMKRVGAQGGIIWDIEGQQFDQAFLGDPTQAETIAPELVGVLDQFIAKFTNAGFPIGFDIEPQVLSFTTGTVNVSGSQVTWTGGSQFSSVWVGQPAGGEITIGTNTYFIASVQSPTSLTIQGNAGTQTNAPYTYVLETNVPNPEAVMASKVAYTRNRWGATLFYVDKDLTYGGTFVTPSQTFEDIMQQYPGTLFFPEWSGIRHYAYTYPFLDSTNGITEPPAKVLQIYPQAAGLVRVPNDQNIQAAVPALIQAVSTGNILLFDGWFPHPGNDTVIQIYQQAP